MSKQNSSGKKIIFLGTPEFAVASLSALLEAGLNVVAVVTAPDKPAGRGMKPKSSAIKTFAVSKQIPVLQPEKLKDPEFLKALSAFQPDLQVVVAFRMLPEIVWNLPSMGTINLHASLLPQYRGAAPINWAVINGESETGLTTFQLQHAIDTGDILLQEKLTIGEEETAGELHDRMMIQGGALLVVTVKGLLAGTLQPTSQQTFINNHTQIHHAPKITRDTCRIDWSQTTHALFNFVRGLSPTYGAFTMFNDKMLKLFRCKKETGPVSLPPGNFTTDYQTYLKFACADGFLSVTELQMEGKKKMSVEEFLRGFRI